MGKKQNKLFTMCMAIILIIALVGCSSSKSQGSDTSTPAATAKPAATEQTKDSSKPKEKVTLHYASYLLDSAQAGNTYLDAIKEFQTNNPNIEVKPDFIQNSNYLTGIKTRLLGGEDVDIFDVWSPSLFNEISKISDKPFLDLAGSPFLNDFEPAFLKPVSKDGKVYGAPELVHTVGLLYNKTLFDKQGLKVPTNWADFLAVSESLKKNNIIPIAMDGENWVPQFIWSPILLNTGGDTKFANDLESGAAKANDPRFVAALKKTKELIDKQYIYKDYAGIKHEQSKDLFGQGKAGMIITGTWDIPSLQDRDKSMDIEVMTTPGNDTGTPIPNFNVGAYRVVNAKTKHPEEAKLFVAFMNGKANLAKMSLGAKAMPSTKDTDVNDPVVKKIKAIATDPKVALYWPHNVSTEGLQTKILDSVNEYLANKPLDQVLAEIQKELDDSRNNK